MAGTLFGLGLSQQFDVNGDPLSGALLYLYAANTTTPANAYRDNALTQLLPWPMPCDSTGRVPAFWVADGNYRARLVDANGVVQFDVGSIPAIGASTTTGTPFTPGSGDPTPVESIFGTGDVKWRPGTEALALWVKLNGLTIGSATSGANHANADANTLFNYLWTNFSSPSGNVLCPVVGGLGSSGPNDWTANKKLTLFDLRGRTPLGLDDMGNAAANMFTGVTFAAGNSAIIGGSTAGAMRTALIQANLPVI